MAAQAVQQDAQEAAYVRGRMRHTYPVAAQAVQQDAQEAAHDEGV